METATEQKPTVDVVLEKNGVTIRCTAYAGGPSLDSVIEIASAALKKTAPARAPRAKGAAGAASASAVAAAGAGALKRTVNSKKLVPSIPEGDAGLDETAGVEQVPSTVVSAKKRVWKKEIEKDPEEGDGDWVASEDDRGSADDSDSGDSLDKAFIDNSVDEVVDAVLAGAVDCSSSEESADSDESGSDSDDAMSVPSNPLRSPVPAGRARKAKAKGSLRTSFMAKLDAAEIPEPPRAPKKPRMGAVVFVASDSEDDLSKAAPEAASPAYVPVVAPSPASAAPPPPLALPPPLATQATLPETQAPAGGSP